MAIIQSHYIGQNGNGNAFVGIRLVVEDWDDALTTKIYLTKAAMGIARAKLKAAGFDVDAQELEALEMNPEMLAGNPVQVEVSEEVYNERPYTKVEIVTDFGKVDKSKLGEITQALRKAKDSDDGKPKAAPSKSSKRAAPSRASDPEAAAQAPAAEEPLVTVDQDPPATTFPATSPEDADIPF